MGTWTNVANWLAKAKKMSIVGTDPYPGDDRHPGGNLGDPVQIPIEEVLDLHTFKPADLGALLPDYLEACHERGIFEVRIIHGKGIGNLQRTVAAILRRLPLVDSYGPASQIYGGSGATIVRLRRK